MTLPKKFGGQGFSLYSYVLAQEAIAQSSLETALSIGWHAGILLEYTESGHWKKEAADWLLPELVNGALVNTAATQKMPAVRYAENTRRF
ncbi:acyl-CoA dehydrogenase family protein [Planococcus sp. ISL-109]|uniref:acyl-CoA dehydrogenase family protein n=1 Tax=Planococcus sp. ISL-109 TaxID=2819166 RepID=UPI0033355962